MQTGVREFTHDPIKRQQFLDTLVSESLYILKNNSKIRTKGEGLRQTTLEKKKVRGFVLSEFNIYYTATIIKTAAWHHIPKDTDQ